MLPFWRRSARAQAVLEGTRPFWKWRQTVLQWHRPFWKSPDRSGRAQNRFGRRVTLGPVAPGLPSGVSERDAREREEGREGEGFEHAGVWAVKWSMLTRARREGGESARVGVGEVVRVAGSPFGLALALACALTHQQGYGRDYSRAPRHSMPSHTRDGTRTRKIEIFGALRSSSARSALALPFMNIYYKLIYRARPCSCPCGLSYGCGLYTYIPTRIHIGGGI